MFKIFKSMANSLKENSTKEINKGNKGGSKLQFEDSKNRIADKLNTELKSELDAIIVILSNMFKAYNLYKEMLSIVKVNLNDEMLYKAFNEIYSATYDINKLTDFENILDNKKVFEIIRKTIGYKPANYTTTFQNGINSEKSLLDIIDVMNNNRMDEIILMDLVNGSIHVVNEAIEKLDTTMNDVNKGESDIYFTRNLLMSYFFFYIKGINKIIVLLRNKEKVTDNNEFYTIQKNLFSEVDDNEYIIEKLYPIYEKFYIDIFEEKLNHKQLFILMNLINKNNKSQYDESFRALFISKIEARLNASNNSEEIYEQVTSILLDYSQDYTHDLANILYLETISSIKDIISAEQIFYLISKESNFVNLVQSYKDQNDLLKEKERLLRGDLSIERSIKEDKLKFENIKDGREFEKYLEELYKKLKYEVETTKISGDQGADLIISKNEIKTVIQAKFYSQPVGNKAVQEVVSAIKFYNADKGMVVTNNFFTKSAIELAEANSIELIDGNKLNNIRELL